MAKSLNQILEVAEPRSQGEKDFKDKHIVAVTDYPVKGTSDVLNAKKSKKDKSKKTHLSKDEEKIAYEEVMEVVNDILAEDYSEEEIASFVDLDESLASIIEHEESEFVRLNDGTEVEITPELAEQIVEIAGYLDEDNEERFVYGLEEGEESLLNMIDFAESVTTIDEDEYLDEEDISESVKASFNQSPTPSGTAKHDDGHRASSDTSSHVYHPLQSHDTDTAHLVGHNKGTGKFSHIKIPLKDEHHENGAVDAAHVKKHLPAEHKHNAGAIASNINHDQFG
tara:strand:- start:1097 stop:1942 length:846 start_codon:yes stop_codon:yes gene_type:complete